MNYQDLDTGEVWGVVGNDIKDVALMPNFPKRISTNIVERPSTYHDWDAALGSWVLNDAKAAEMLAEAKLLRSVAINSACAAEITGGFISSALGTPHAYDSDETNQLNLIGAVGMGVDTPYKCTDTAGVKDFRLHTAAQIKQVLEDGAMVKLLALQKAAVLKAQVAAAGTVVEVEAVVW